MSMQALKSIRSVFQELKRRKVYPVIAAYAVVGWVVLQIGEVTFAPLGFPDWLMTGLVVLVIAGFPLVVVLAWIFDITPVGLRRDVRKATNASDARAGPSIAVLPFVDMSPEKDQQYFCEGVAEEILNALTKIRKLHVVARMSSFQYKDGRGDVRQIGRKLGVKAILEGSVRKSGEQLRVTVQLVKVENGFHIWSKIFDESPQDIFTIQDEIATGVAESLLDTLTPVRTASTRDVLAYEYYLRGRQFFNRFRRMDIDYAIQMYRQAIEVDPHYAKAWAGYADCNSFLIMYVDPRDEYRDEAHRASKTALELDPDLAEAHASRGLAHLISEDFERAENEFDEALRINPCLFEAYYYYARTRFHQGDMEKAVELFAKAADANPDDYQSRLLRVQTLRGMGRLEQANVEAMLAIANVETHLKWNPDDARALHLGAGSLIQVGEIDRAEEWLQRALEIDPYDSVVLYNVACNYAILGKVDIALGYLEQAIEHGTVSASWMKNDEDLANLRESPRYRKILESIDD